jgi:hypothetical protein
MSVVELWFTSCDSQGGTTSREQSWKVERSEAAYSATSASKCLKSLPEVHTNPLIFSLCSKAVCRRIRLRTLSPQVWNLPSNLYSMLVIIGCGLGYPIVSEVVYRHRATISPRLGVLNQRIDAILGTEIVPI